MKELTEPIALLLPPGEVIKDELDARGWSQADLATILGRPPRVVSEIVRGKRAISPETASELANAFGTSAQLWLNLDSAYRLARRGEKRSDDEVARRAALYEKAPVKQLLDRHWIKPATRFETLERHVLEFLEMNSVTDEPRFVFAPRRSATDTQVGAAHIAWLYRARQLAQSVEAKPFQPARLEQTLQQLRPLLASDVDVARVPKVLAEGGIRFVIVKHLAGTRIEGATFWDEGRPVVVLSMRYPRIDWFWHTLMHELGHVQQGDTAENAVRLDLEPDERDHATAERSPAEVEADEFAASYLIDDAALARLVGPISAASVQAFAHSVGVHPGIVVGRLHFRQSLPYSQLRRFLVDVRRHIVKAATTDGWYANDSKA